MLGEKQNVLMPAEELVRERAKNSIHSYFRNTTLALLKKSSKDFTSLTTLDKQLKLKLYDLRRDGERLPSLMRAPLIFPVARKFESNHSRFKKLTYKSISIIFD
jgi:pantoate kinase